MRIALLSDIHANLPALEACLEAAGKLAVDRLVFLGDFVGYGPDPEAVVQRIMPLVRDGAIAILGNHDQAAIGPTRNMNATAAQAIDWTRRKLSGDAAHYLAGLPMSHGEDGLLFVHADASAPARWNYVTNAEAAARSLNATPAFATFCGHTHMPQLFSLSATGKLIGHTPVTDVAIPLSPQRRWLAVIGSAGQPRDGNPAASFATYDSERRELTYRRVPYDVETVAAHIRLEGLPEVLATRLVAGR